MKVLFVGNGLNLRSLEDDAERKKLYTNILSAPSNLLYNEIKKRAREKLLLNFKSNNSIESFNAIKQIKDESKSDSFVFDSFRSLFKIDYNRAIKSIRPFIKARFEYLLSLPESEFSKYEALSNLLALSDQTGWLNGINKFIIDADKKAGEEFLNLMFLPPSISQLVKYPDEVRRKLLQYEHIFTTNFDVWLSWNNLEKDKPGKKIEIHHLHGIFGEYPGGLLIGPHKEKLNAGKMLDDFFRINRKVSLDIFGMSMVSEVHIVDSILKACYRKSISKINQYIHEDYAGESSPSSIKVISKNYLIHLTKKKWKRKIGYKRMEKVFRTDASSNWESEKEKAENIVGKSDW